MSTMMSEEMESATITLESVGESGDKLHALNCGGDLAGVVEMFTRALQVEVSGEGDINTTLNVSHPYLQDRYFYNIGLQALLKTKRHELAKGILQRGVIDRGVEFGADTIHIFINGNRNQVNINHKLGDLLSNLILLMTLFQIKSTSYKVLVIEKLSLHIK